MGTDQPVARMTGAKLSSTRHGLCHGNLHFRGARMPRSARAARGSGGWKPGIRAPVGWALVRTRFQAHSGRLPAGAFPDGERERALGSLPLVGTPIPSMGALLPNTISGMRVGASTRGFQRDTDVQSMALASTEGACRGLSCILSAVVG